MHADIQNRTMSLRTVEKAYSQEIELGMSETVLFSSLVETVTALPSSVLFSLPLMPDTPPSCHHTPIRRFHIP